MITSVQLEAQLPFHPDTVKFIEIENESFGYGRPLLSSDQEGRIWISTTSGIYGHHGYGWEQLTHDFKFSHSNISPHGARSFRGKNGYMWFVLFHSGLIRLDLNSGEKDFISPAEIHGHDHYDHIWNVTDIGLHDSLVVHTDRGFAYLNPTSMELSTFIEPVNDSAYYIQLSDADSEYYNGVRGIVALPNKPHIYFIPSHISYTYNTLTKEWKPFGYGPDKFEDEKGLFFEQVFKRNDEIWLVGRRCGFRKVDYTKDNATNYLFEETTEDGLHNRIYDYHRVNDSIYLFSASKTCGIFNLNSKHYNLFEGLSKITPEEWAAFGGIEVDGGGHVWASSHLGIYRSKHPVFPRTKGAKFHLEILEIDGVVQNNFKHWRENNVIDISRKGNIEFSYYLINPAFSNDLEYRHRLIGHDQEDVVSSPVNKNRYAQLSPGKYTLELIANNKNEKSIRSLRYEINVKAYWYDHWYSKVLIAFGIIGILGYLFSNRVQKARIEERLKLEYESKLTQLEMNALRAQMNPHFVFNSLNSIKSYLIKKGPNEAADYLTRFGYLIRIILENSKHDILTLEQELKAIKLYVEMENKRFKNPFEFAFEVDSDIDVLYAQIPPMLIQPYVENAIWHGLMPNEKDRKLSIKIVKIDQGILCIIEDNGVGRNGKKIHSDPLQTKASLGHKITAERIETINKIHSCDIRVEIEDLKNVDKIAQGTRVKLYIIGLRI